jgi:hypothetical protein
MTSRLHAKGAGLMSHRLHNHKKRIARINSRSTARLMRTLAASCQNPARVLELYYWSREPGLTEIIRAIVAMPEQSRAALEAFIAISGDPKTVVATLDRCGALTLTSAEAAKTIALARYAAQDDIENAPHRLN